MRPALLFPFFAQIEGLPGIGPRTAPLIARLVGGGRVIDLLTHLPTGLVDRRNRPMIGDAVTGDIATIDAEVTAHHPPRGPKQPYRIIVSDETGFLTLVFFKGREDYFGRQLPVGKRRLVSGRIEDFQGAPQIIHPDFIIDPENAEEVAALPLLEPVYPLTQGVSSRVLRKAMTAALQTLPDALPEWNDRALLAREGWPDFISALSHAHAPAHPDDLDPQSPARQRLAFDELLAGALALTLVRRESRRAKPTALVCDGRLRQRFLAQLPFTPTADQTRAIAEIVTDMTGPSAMVRLLQGDVGAGKTVVAFAAMLAAVEAGGQAVLLAPTEILAQQHFDTISSWASTLGLEAVFLSGRIKGRGREDRLIALAAGDAVLAVGTHALIQDDVRFRLLLLAVIDEQHRFGVQQRLALVDKGEAVDLLAMTATPIPRSLALTAYGDMAASLLREKPPGRKPVDTRVVAQSRLSDVIAGIARALDQGEQIFWVCPLVEQSEISDLAAAEARFAELKRQLTHPLALIHGRLSGGDKDKAMAAFAAGQTRLLVATTVIEVGVDVPAASIMVIEQAERFGLAQLHQLRGRIGRGDKPGTCILVRSDEIGANAAQRLAAIRSSNDGFFLAEEDLKLRGAGELLGKRQSGLPVTRFADLRAHHALIAMAHDDARLLTDPERDRSARAEALGLLLHLFDKQSALRLIGSG